MPKLPESVKSLESAPVVPVEDAGDDRLRAFAAHGVELSGSGSEVHGDCPICLRDGKFYVAVSSGLWQCKVCGAHGNPVEFVRQLHAACSVLPLRLPDPELDRGFLDPAGVLSAWGACRGRGGRWMVPGYSADGRLDQLYRYTKLKEDGGQWRRVLMPTPGVWPDGEVHALHMAASDLDWSRQEVWLTEGPWDGMALWEVARHRTTTPQVLALPGCNVFRDRWLDKVRGKDVVIWFDNDHPRARNGSTFRAGFDATYRLSKKLSGIAKSVRWLRWGKEGYDLTLKDGYDVNDHLRTGKDMAARSVLLDQLLAKVEPAPADWFSPVGIVNGHVGNGTKYVSELEPRSCSSWSVVEGALKDALEWRQAISDAAAVMFAVCGSTLQGGNQLFLDLVAQAGSAKTTLCDGLLVSKSCHHLEHFTGFHSGFKLPGSPDKDCSLAARVNGKTLITSEADVLISSPDYKKLMSEQRRLFDGKSGATYKNSDVDVLLTGLRTPWIRAGTPAILDTDQTSLGDRFIRVIMDLPSESMKRNILRRALRNEMESMAEESNGTHASIVNPKMRKAQELMGGYVDWLRANMRDRVVAISMPESVEDSIIDMAELTADMRARPLLETKNKQETHETKELPARLVSQFGKLAKCLAIVLNRQEIDSDVIRVTKLVALSTAFGRTQNICRWLASCKSSTGQWNQDRGLFVADLALWSSEPEEKMKSYLLFLRKIGVVELVKTAHHADRWRLTERVFDLYRRVCGYA